MPVINVGIDKSKITRSPVAHIIEKGAMILCSISL